jgi:hypothetical protein
MNKRDVPPTEHLPVWLLIACLMIFVTMEWIAVISLVKAHWR